ncbi:PEP-CTERM sorting domain-containing protein [Coraliomargarita sp. SDUM461004]|uniref:PEP-CTERM sorting domain-containing protein n=1 Tax=Thalassobacterium sedimentorum TaxID=3041258 RepID=A0ABU1AH16_9BACT|nr:PEP-CTERM sorting domain-containing protein [Coraliomargarita sp. SDUM461004]MDQ8194112.1 PEP-CTERM sorting domain-containing protein [Coraliomargarita sp. SDUM461004]
MKKTPIILAAALVFAVTSYGQATVTFDGPVRIFNSDPATTLDTDGTLLLGMNVGSASDVIVDTNRSEGSLTFTGSDISGATQTVSGGGVSLTVSPDNAFASRGEATYSNNPDLETLFSSFAMSNASNAASSRITLSLSGLTDGQEYRLQLLHYDPGVEPNSREMNLYNADDLLNNTGVFTYYDSSSNIALNAVVITATWTAVGTTQSFFLDGEGAFDRSVLNAAILHSIPEPATYAAFAGLLAFSAIMFRRCR